MKSSFRCGALATVLLAWAGFAPRAAVAQYLWDVPEQTACRDGGMTGTATSQFTAGLDAVLTF
jgi:hypothetical protein